MRRSSFLRMAVCLLAALLTGTQVAAAVQACDIASSSLHLHTKDAVCTEAVPGVPHCAPEHRAACDEHVAAVPGATPEAKAGWPESRTPADAARASFPRANFSAAGAQASRLSRLVPEVRNLSIALLNLRQ